jgi:ectoine hydroxylase-related dioxygenase (phytanoyl-CoA dioxygenase family)
VEDRHIQEMESEGYTLFERVFTGAEMAELEEIFETFEAQRRAELAAQGGSQSISRADEITFNDHLAERDERIRAFVSRPEFKEIASRLLGTPNVGVYWNQTVFKMPEGDKIFPWHQDDAYTPVEPAPYLTLWLAINDATLENGCVSVMPGSHLEGLTPHEPSPIGLVCHPADHPNQGVPVPAPAGSIVAFWSLTKHKSAPNRSQGIRKAYVVQYAPLDLKIKATGEQATVMALS